MIETTKHPYELLVRWGEDGKLRAAHVGFALVSIEDGKQIGWSPQPVMPVAVGKAQGYPLKDILAQVQIDALTDRDTAIEEKTAALAELVAEKAKLVTAQAELEVLKKAAAK